MSNLSTYLKIAHAGPSERKDIIERAIPRELGTYDGDGKIVSVRELLLTEAIESTTLIQTEMYSTVMEGAEPQRCFRQAVPMFRTNGNTLRVPYGSSGTYASEVAEGSEVPIGQQDYAYRDFTIKKYGTRPLITRELIDDGLFDAVAMEVRKAGASVENRLNQLVLSCLLDNAGNEHDTAGSNQGIKAIASAVGLVKEKGYIPDTIVLCPQAEALTLKEFVPTGYVGADAAMAGRLPSLMGLRVFTCGVTDDSPTYTWQYDSDGDIGMLVYDSRNAGGIAMRRDLTVSRYEDPIRDLVGCTVTARFGVNYLAANAICRVEY
jgi:HK97 family phage major capsid protein